MRDRPTTLLVAPLLGVIALSVVSATAVVQAAVVRVDQRGLRFSQSSIAVAAGDHVAFTNTDDVQHNIVVINDGGDEADQGLQKPGETIDVLLAARGHFTIRCAIHPRMKLGVDVR
jgi:plastocyanin